MSEDGQRLIEEQHQLITEKLTSLKHANNSPLPSTAEEDNDDQQLLDYSMAPRAPVNHPLEIQQMASSSINNWLDDEIKKERSR